MSRLYLSFHLQYSGTGCTYVMKTQADKELVLLGTIV
jgi:hypothetical protein